jgi:hypothetical protein
MVFLDHHFSGAATMRPVVVSIPRVRITEVIGHDPNGCRLGILLCANGWIAKGAKDNTDRQQKSVKAIS